jgi:hypothetical protein
LSTAHRMLSESHFNNIIFFSENFCRYWQNLMHALCYVFLVVLSSTTTQTLLYLIWGGNSYSEGTKCERVETYQDTPSRRRRSTQCPFVSKK